MRKGGNQYANTTGRCVYIYYKGIIQRFAEKKSVLQEIYYRYGKMFACAISLCGYVFREANRIVYDPEDRRY